MKLLICGGAGYIGSHMVKRLLEKNIEPVAADNLATGHRQAVPEDVPFYQGDIRDGAFLDKIFRENKIDGVVHFAADSLVGESMKVPLKYFGNNVGGMMSMLEAMVRADVDKLIFPQRRLSTVSRRVFPSRRRTGKIPSIPTASQS